MACLHFDALGAHALSHEAFEIGIDRPVLRGNGIEARLRPPGRLCGLAREQSLVSELYSSFTEGFDTADLRRAKELLDTLSAP